MKTKIWNDKKSTAALAIGETDNGVWLSSSRTRGESFTMGLSPSEARMLASWLVEAAYDAETSASIRDMKRNFHQCTLNKPLLMVIPPDGCDICCPIHGKHRIFGTQVLL